VKINCTKLGISLISDVICDVFFGNSMSDVLVNGKPFALEIQEIMYISIQLFMHPYYHLKCAFLNDYDARHKFLCPTEKDMYKRFNVWKDVVHKIIQEKMEIIKNKPK
jgi:hypothetical protein